MKFRIRRSFEFKPGTFVMTIAVITFLIVLAYNYYASKDIIIGSIREDTRTLAISTLFQISTVITAAQKVPENLSYILECTEFNEREINELLKNIVKNNQEIYGSTISFEPYMFEKSRYSFGPYFYKSDGNIKYSDLGDKNYDYLKQEWYTLPKKLNKGIWSEPYFDKGGGNTFMMTYSQPFYKNINGKREFCGIATCDISLDWLEKLISKIKIFNTGYAFIVSAKGNFVTHPNREYYTEEQNLFSLADKYNDPTLKTVAKKMTTGEAGFDRGYSRYLKKTAYLYYEPIRSTGLSLGIVIPENELFSKLNTLTITLFLIGAIGNLLSLTLKVSLSKKIMMPVLNLAKKVFKKGS